MHRAARQAQAERLDRARAVARHEDVGGVEQLLGPGPAVGGREVEQRGPLALPRVEVLDLDLGQARRVDAQDVRAEQRERPGRDGPGDDAGEIQDPEAGERPGPDGERARGSGVVAHRGPHGRARRRGPARRGRAPLVRGAHAHGDRADRGREVLDLLRRPRGERRRDVVPGRVVRDRGGQVEEREQPRAVVRVVRVRADPAVRRAEEAGQRREPVHRSAVDPQQPVARERRRDALGIRGRSGVEPARPRRGVAHGRDRREREAEHGQRRSEEVVVRASRPDGHGTTVRPASSSPGQCWTVVHLAVPADWAYRS